MATTEGLRRQRGRSGPTPAAQSASGLPRAKQLLELFRRTGGALVAGLLLLCPGFVSVAGATTITEFPIPTPNSSSRSITTGPDGALWFTEFNASKIGRITTAGAITEFPIPTPSSFPRNITAGPDGALWFTEFNGNKIGRITTTGAITEFPIPTAGSLPEGITAGPDGALWFTEGFGKKIGRITTAGTITEFPIATAVSVPVGITAGPDGALWFTEFGANKIGRITTAGTITEFALPTPVSGPIGITAGPDGALWFTEFNGNRIGRIVPDSVASVPTLVNLSTRARVETGDNVMIGGFIIGGSAPKTVLVRAVGPSLAAFGVPGPLANPTLQLFAGPTAIAENDDWQVPLPLCQQTGHTCGTPAEIASTGLAPTQPLEAVVLIQLPPGPYTAIVRGLGGTTGVGLVEVFEVDSVSRLTNISTRALVQTGDNVMIGGFIIGGGPKTVLVRVIGPSLATFGVPGVLANPVVQLFSGQTALAANDDWQTSPQAAAIAASGLAPSHPVESAILITLAPGPYTAIVRGVGGTTGVGLVEVFEVPGD